MSSKNPISVLRYEHEVIQSVEIPIKSLDKLWEHDPILYSKFAFQLVKFFREYADKLHHWKEEEIFFKALKDCVTFTSNDFVNELEDHHSSFREYLKDIEELLIGHDYAGAHQLLTEYLSDLLDHIAAENDELFVIAETHLDKEQLESIYFKFKDIDIEYGELKIKELENLTTEIISHSKAG